MEDKIKSVTKKPLVKLGVDITDPVTLGIIVSIAVVLLTLILIWLLRRNKTSRRCVLMVGLSESGKTLLFSRIAASKRVDSYTSMKENSSILTLEKNKTVKLVDIPGNDRLRFKFLEDYKKLARAIIFVIDSLNFSREIRDVAELLYAILGDKSLTNSSPSFLIACNKQDETMAKSSKVIQSQLEKEINTIRVTQTSALDSISDSKNNNAFLGRRGKDFAFSDLKPLSVEFLECSAKDEDDNNSKLNDFRNWLNKIA